MRFSSSKTNKFRSGKGERCCDENVAKAFEAVIESSWGIPVFASNVTTVFGATAVDYCAEDATICQ